MYFTSIFGAPRISLNDAKDLSDDAPEIIACAIPFMFFFVLLEMYFSYRHNRQLYSFKETIASTIVGLGNVLISFCIKFSLFVGAIALYNALPWRMVLNWYTLLPCYIILDFCSYWSHRLSHQLRFFWATHIVHHSGEDYNLTVSFRLSWVQHFKLIFFIPVALCGFHPIIFFVANQIAVMFQFWVHTEYIKKMPLFFEYLFATPSNHRVHHGCQEKYINKNYGATFIIWDRMFGTYEKEEEKVMYGLNHKIENKGNPVHINFHEFVDIWKDMKGAKSLRLKFFYLFGNPIKVFCKKQNEKKAAPETPKEIV